MTNPTLSELLKGLRDCSKEAFSYTARTNPDCDSQEFWFYEECRTYKAGHAAACDVLIPVIEEALKALKRYSGSEALIQSPITGEFSVRVVDTKKNYSFRPSSDSDIESIKSLLEKAVSK